MFLALGRAHYLNVKGGGLKGQMNFHVASRGGGVAINFGFPAWGHVLIVPIKSLKNFLARFTQSNFIN